MGHEISKIDNSDVGGFKINEDVLSLKGREKKFSYFKEKLLSLIDENKICQNELLNKFKDKLQFHHFIYRMPVKETDFITLCRRCHSALHFKQKLKEMKK